MKTLNKYYIQPLSKTNILLPEDWDIKAITYVPTVSRYVFEIECDLEAEIEYNLSLVLACDDHLALKLYTSLEGVIKLKPRPSNNSLILLREIVNLNAL